MGCNPVGRFLIDGLPEPGGTRLTSRTSKRARPLQWPYESGEDGLIEMRSAPPSTRSPSLK